MVCKHHSLKEVRFMVKYEIEYCLTLRFLKAKGKMVKTEVLNSLIQIQGLVGHIVAYIHTVHTYIQSQVRCACDILRSKF